MANWLELEERNKELEEKKKVLEANEAKIRAQDRAQKEDLIHNNLIPFFDLCERVEKLENISLAISKLKVTTKEHIHDEYASRNFSQEVRGIFFSNTSSNQINIEIRHYKDTYYGGYRIDSEHADKLYLSKICSNEDILNWREEDMINTIRWIIFKFDTIKENLPGEKGDLIKEEKKEEDEDNHNRDQSILKGIWWGLSGVALGFGSGIILGLIIWPICSIFGLNIGQNVVGYVTFITTAICGILGYIIGFTERRNKKAS